MRLFISNLHPETTGSDLRRTFNAHGHVIKAWIVLDEESGKPRGHGFVEMDLKDAMKAMKALDRSWLKNKRIFVQKSRFMPHRRRNKTEDRSAQPSGGRF
jgi:RNA recognition motif-containing protein